MKFVVTGGAGFIGSHIVKHLIKSGHEVTIIDNLFRGKLENLKQVENQFDFHKIDILDFNSIKNVIQNCDGIFHEAALTSVPESFTQTEKYHQVNVVGTENIFKLAKEYDLKVVYASSSSVYGNTTQIPISENLERNPINPYGQTKLDDEHLAENYAKSGGKIIGLRYFNVYGIGQTLDYAGVITKFLERLEKNESPVIFGDGSQIRDFVFVEDVAEANLAAFESKVDFGFFNVGTGVTTSISDLANIMIRLSGVNTEPTYDDLPLGDVKISQANIEKTLEKISWKYKTILENGLQIFFDN